MIWFDARLEHYDVIATDDANAIPDAPIATCPAAPQRVCLRREHQEDGDEVAKQRCDGKDHKASHLGSTQTHLVMTVNVEGSREALVNAMDPGARILLIEEHRIAGPGLPGIQGLGMGKGWHGVWDAACAHGNGRSGGTAVLVRPLVQVVRGGQLDRGTVAIVNWARRSRIHVVSVCNAHEGDPQHEETTRGLCEQLQGYIAEEASPG